MLSQQVECLGLSSKQAMLSRFQEAFRTMWTQNGDHISRMYLGTGALDGKAKVQYVSLCCSSYTFTILPKLQWVFHLVSSHISFFYVNLNDLPVCLPVRRSSTKFAMVHVQYIEPSSTIFWMEANRKPLICCCLATRSWASSVKERVHCCMRLFFTVSLVAFHPPLLVNLFSFLFPFFFNRTATTKWPFC